MNKRIVYQLPEQPVSIIIPCECGLTIQDIGIKDVPNGVPFWIVPMDSIPTDCAFRDAWELDYDALGEPTGVGA